MLARVVRAIEPARRARVQSGSQRTSLGTSEAGARSMRPPSGGLTVPELTRSASIQLNERVSLRHQLNSLSLPTGYCPHPDPAWQSRQASYSAWRLLFSENFSHENRETRCLIYL
jgi:spore coat protein CotF